MKKYIILTVLSVAFVVIVISYSFAYSTLPYMSGANEIIGVGRVVKTWSNEITNSWFYGEGIIINVDDYWRGNPGTNILSVYARHDIIPTTNTPIVFYAFHRFDHHSECVEPWEYYDFKLPVHYSYVFKKKEWDCVCVPQLVWTGLLSSYSWFYVNETNSNLFAFASNLVFAVNTSNTNLYYKTVRDGYRLHPKNSLIHNDSNSAFRACEYWMTPEFMEQNYKDPLLSDLPRNDIFDAYRYSTGSRLPTNDVPWRRDKHLYIIPDPD